MFKIDKGLNYGPRAVQAFIKQVPEVNTAVDVGAGLGRDLEIVRAVHPAAKLLALESFEQYAKQLEDKGISTFRLNFEREKIPVKDESVDLLISNQMLEHSKEVFWILHEISRVLRVGGYLILGVPNLASLHNRLLLFLGKQPTCIQNKSAHVRGFTFGDIKTLLEVFPGGFQVQGRRGSNFYPFPPFLAQPLAAVFPSLAWGMFLLLKKGRSYSENYFINYPDDQKLETNFFLG